MLVLDYGSGSCLEEESIPMELLDINNLFYCYVLPTHLMPSLISVILLFTVDYKVEKLGFPWIYPLI